MKKKLGLLILCMLSSACMGTKTNTAEASILINDSQIFTTSEIKSAIGKVKESFYDFGECEIQSFFYVDDYLDIIAEIHGEESVESIYDASVPSEYRMVITVEFTTGEDINGPLEENTTYTNWCWFLQRNSTDGEWYVLTYKDIEDF